MNEIHPTIVDIQTTELICYDRSYSSDCYRFCKDRDIDCLPVVDDPDTFFLRNDDSQRFDECVITRDRRLDAMPVYTSSSKTFWNTFASIPCNSYSSTGT
jgi:hypothetical protein